MPAIPEPASPVYVPAPEDSAHNSDDGMFADWDRFVENIPVELAQVHSQPEAALLNGEPEPYFAVAQLGDDSDSESSRILAAWSPPSDRRDPTYSPDGSDVSI